MSSVSSGLRMIVHSAFHKTSGASLILFGVSTPWVSVVGASPCVRPRPSTIRVLSTGRTQGDAPTTETYKYEDPLFYEEASLLLSNTDIYTFV